MKLIDEQLSGLKVIALNRHEDERGVFFENYQQEKYQGIGIDDCFIQDNVSRSGRNVLRGLHFTHTNGQSQLVTVVRGNIYDVCVDIRQESKTFGEWFGVFLGDDFESTQIYMPFGFAHGFVVLSDFADLHYKVNRYYDPSDEGGILWSDPDIGINWPIATPYVGIRDQSHGYLSDVKRK